VHGFEARAHTPLDTDNRWDVVMSEGVNAKAWS
jgi:hypothetical protein